MYIDQFQVRQVDLENQLGDIKKERDDLKAKYEKVGNDYETLRRTQTSKEEDAKKRHSRLEERGGREQFGNGEAAGCGGKPLAEADRQD